MASLKAVEEAMGIEINDYVKWRRELINSALYIRDHALHLIVFVLPDLYNVDSILDFDETDPVQRSMIENLFALKAAGNNLANFSGSRAVHAPDLMLGGFGKAVDPSLVPGLKEELQKARPIAVQLVDLFASVNFNLTRNNRFLAMRGEDHFDYILTRKLRTHDGREFPDKHYRQHLQHVSIPYSHASGYQFEGHDFMVGSLARVNINKDQLHKNTLESCATSLERFPSNNVFDNNLAQAIETVDAIDYALDLLDQNHDHTPPLQPTRESGDGIGLIEAPRGMLYHSAHVVDKIIDRYEVIVPTGQNQINIENDLKLMLQNNLDKMDQKQLEHESEKVIRAYDPCMSCASHFLKVRWDIK